MQQEQQEHAVQVASPLLRTLAPLDGTWRGVQLPLLRRDGTLRQLPMLGPQHREYKASPCWVS